MKSVLTRQLPPSQPGQFMRESVGPGNTVQREILQTCTNPKSLASNGSTIWAGKYGGWVRVH